MSSLGGLEQILSYRAVFRKEKLRLHSRGSETIAERVLLDES